MTTALARRADVAAPGVIVSTITGPDAAQTVIFRTEPDERLGYTTEVLHDTPGNARAQHELALNLVTEAAA